MMEQDFRPFSCHSCDKRYLRKNNLEDHVLMEHPDSDQASDIVAQKASKGRSKGSLIIECEICSKRFRYQSDLKNHFESHFRQPGKRGRLSFAAQQARLLHCESFVRPEVRPEARSDDGARAEREVRGRSLPVVLTVIDRTVEEFGEDWDDEDYCSSVLPLPPPAFLPPPPPLPTPEKTFTVLLSEDDSNTSSLITNGPLSPSREVLDLSISKPDTPALSNGHLEEESGGSEGSSDGLEEGSDEKKTSAEEDFENVEEDCTISIEPSRLPSMPAAIIAIQSQLEQYLNGLTEDEWKEFEEAGLVDNYSPQADKSRLDCKYCGIIFTDIHVRKFHEESHKEAKEEDNYDEGEHTRLFCGFCSKMFKSVKFRKVHEMTHSPDDIQFLEENMEYLREIDLKNRTPAPVPIPEERLYRPEDPFRAGGRVLSQARVRPRLIDQEGWVEDHPSLPVGWRMKTRPRPSQEGQLFFVFLSPDNKVFHSRKAVIEHMKMIGGYTQVDYDRVKEGAKPGPRNKKRRSQGGKLHNEKRRKLELDCENSKDSTGFASYRDLDDDEDFDDEDSESESNDSESEECELFTNWRDHSSLPTNCKMRAVEAPSGRTSFQYLSADQEIFNTRKEMVQHLRRKRQSEIKRKRMMEVRKKMPKRKKLVTNQVIVTKATNKQRKLFLSKNKKKKSELFRYEPVIFVPKLGDMIEPEDNVKIDLKTFSVEIEDLKDVDNLKNNVQVIKKELRERQLDYESKLSSSEEETEDEESKFPPTSAPVRTLRKRTSRMVYEEPPLEDELDSKFFKELRQQTKAGSVERGTVNGNGTSAITTETSNLEEDDLEGEMLEEEEDCLSDSWEAELFALKRNPREKVRFQDEDLAILNDWFYRNPYPDKKEQVDVSKILMVPLKNVKHWFQTKRVKCKENGKILSKRDNKRKLSDCDGEEEESQPRYCRQCRQPFSQQAHLSLHNKRFHKKKYRSQRKQQRIAQEKGELRTQEKFTRSKAMADKLTAPKIPTPVDDLQEIYEYIDYKRIRKKDQISELKDAYNGNKNPKKDEINTLAKELDLSASAVTGWFRTQRRNEEVESEVKERLISSPSILRHYGRIVTTAKDWLSNRNKHCTGKRSELNHYQRSYLKYYFMQKQFIDSDDVNEICCELSLSAGTVTKWFGEARARKRIRQPLPQSVCKGRARGRPKKITIDTSRISFTSDDEDLFDLDGLDTNTSSVPMVFASKSRGASEAFKDGNIFSVSEHQKSRLEKFHDAVECPDDEDIDFLAEHLKVSRQSVVNWFDCKRKEKEYEKKESVILCRELIADFVFEISRSKNFSFIPVPEFSCKYCGEKFTNEQDFREHENIEAEEFEPEKFNLQNNHMDFETIDSHEGSTKLDDIFVSDEDDAHDYAYNSSHYEDSVDISISSFKGKNSRTYQPYLKTNKKNEFSDFKRKPEKVNFRNYFSSPGKNYDFDDYSGSGKRKSITTFKGYFCKKCNMGFYLKSSLQQHLRSCQPSEATSPGKRFELQVGLVVGREEEDVRPLRCYHCKAEFRTRSELSRHLYSHYQQHNGISQPGEAETRPQYYSRDTDLMSHLYQDEDPVTYETFSRYFDSKQAEACDVDDTQNFFDISRLDSISWNKPEDQAREEDFEIKKEKTRTKIRFTDVQRGVLMKSFRQSHKMNKHDFKSLYEELADTLELPVTTIKVWFQNARSARKKGNPHYM